MAYINGKKILHTIKTEYIEVHPSIVDTEANILALTSDKGLAVATDTGYWYYWNSTTSQYTYGGVYQATELADGSVTYKKTNFLKAFENILDFNNESTIVNNGKFVTNLNYPNGSANSGYSFIVAPVEANTQYTVKMWFFILCLDANDNILSYYNVGQDGLVNHTFTTPNNCVKIAFNTTPSASASAMIIKGDTYPNEYKAAGVYYEFDGQQVYAKVDEVENVEKYYVGANKQYTTFTQCIKALASNTNKKIIYIDEGTYDIFNEIGGSTYALSIASGTSWVNCNDIIPNNTTIIGLGEVIFNFMPTAAQIGNIACNLLSPINIMGNVTLENITIKADNCRYCIHDETGDGYDNAIKNYKNIKCFKYSSDGLGYPQAYASGFYKGVSFNFDSCYFESTNECISFHDRNYNSGNININNSVFVCRNTSANYSIRFGNVAYSQKHHKVYINNCYVTNKIYINAENGNETINSYDLQVIGCNNPTIELASVLTTNIYAPKVYN